MTASANAELSPSPSPSPSPLHENEVANNANANGGSKDLSSSSSSSAPVVYSFRPQPHAHRNDGSGAVHHSLPHSEPTGWYLFIQLLFSIIMVHYFLWSIVCIVFVLFIGYFHWSFALVAIAAYLPSFLNGDQFKGSGRPWEAFRRHRLWHLIQDYMQVEIVRTAKLDSNKQYIFGAYPHGILILSRAATYGGLWERLFPGIDFRVLGASPMFYIPGCRELCLWMGAINAAKKTAEEAISKYKKSLIVYPGGSAEIFTTDPKSSDTTLVVRKGFIKLAMQQGADVVPVFVFGEKWFYHRRFLPPIIHNFFMNALRTPLILFWGIWGTWLPRRLPLSMVFGKPISRPKNPHPSDEEIDAVWDEYQTQLQNIFQKYKSTYGYGPEEKLVFKDAKETKKHV